MIHVLSHAVDRYIERVSPQSSRTEARGLILKAERAIEAAASFGHATVKMANGERLVVDGTWRDGPRVVTVYGPGMLPRESRTHGGVA